MRYSVILADPPWPYNARKNPSTKFGLGVHGAYAQLKYPELAALPICDICEKQAILFLWTTWPQLPQQLEVLKHWGFRYKTNGFLWVKLNARNGKPCFGVGNYSKSNSEACILATRGKPLLPAVNTVSSHVEAPRPKLHSAKPPEVRERIRLMYPDLPALELFARQRAPTWDALGNELDGLDIRESLPRLAVASSFDTEFYPL